MKPTHDELQLAIVRLSMLRYFPGDEATRAAIMDELLSLCGTGQQLRWLTDVMVRQVGEWKGPAEMRGIFCTQFRPADGVETVAHDTPGFTPAEIEQRSFEAHEARKAGFYIEPRTGERKQLTGVPDEILKLAASKRLN